MINMTELFPPGLLVEVALVDFYGKELYSQHASINKNNPYLYHVGPFIPPKGHFFVRVSIYCFCRIVEDVIITMFYR